MQEPKSGGENLPKPVVKPGLPQMKPDRSLELEAQIDARLADIWAFIFSLPLNAEELGAQAGPLLRMAFMEGYLMALAEAPRGAFIRRLTSLASGRQGGGTR